MKKSQGTYCYIFSDQCLQTLTNAGFILSAPQENSGLKIHNVWVRTPDMQPYCLQFREICNEEFFYRNTYNITADLISPGFMETDLGTNKPVMSDFILKGFLLQDIPEVRGQVLQWELPSEVIWGQPGQNLFLRQLWYRKKFSHWGLLLEPTASAQNTSLNKFPEVDLPPHKVRWISTETISWDLLIHSAPGLF